MPTAFKVSTFSRWAKKCGLDDVALNRAVKEMEDGLIDAQLGGGLVKKRIAVGSSGKRGGARVIVATNFGGRWFFLYGFEKNERDNIDTREMKALQIAAAALLKMDSASIKKALALQHIEEIQHD